MITLSGEKSVHELPVSLVVKLCSDSKCEWYCSWFFSLSLSSKIYIHLPCEWLLLWQVNMFAFIHKINSFCNFLEFRKISYFDYFDSIIPSDSQHSYLSGTEEGKTNSNRSLVENSIFHLWRIVFIDLITEFNQTE